MTTKEFYEKLKEDVGELGEVKTEKDTEIQMPDEQIEMLRALFAEWAKRMSIQGLKKYLNDFLKKPTQENGKVYELLVYAWLERNFPCYVVCVKTEVSFSGVGANCVCTSRTSSGTSNSASSLMDSPVRSSGTTIVLSTPYRSSTAKFVTA